MRAAAVAFETGRVADLPSALAFLRDTVAQQRESVASKGPAALTASGAEALSVVIPRLVASAWVGRYPPELLNAVHGCYCDVLSLAVAMFDWIDKCPPMFAAMHLLLGTVTPGVVRRVFDLGTRRVISEYLRQSIAVVAAAARCRR